VAEADPRPAFSVLPAIDLRRGRCVRLEKGEAASETVYSDDPVAMARSFAEAGARWVHVVDLDAAFGEGGNRELIREIAAAVPLRVQTGGGLRSDADLEAVLEGGVARAVIGTAALEDPELVRRAVERWGADRIAVGLDARGRRPAARGWTEESGEDLFDVGRSLVRLGVRTLIYTDIERDGMLQGPNLVMAAALANFTGAEVIVSGGISALEDVVEVNRERRMGIRLSGVIVGKAYYEGRIDLAEAVRRVEG
jgi:phosphoribosylformimino-5-aminoimidazole carboxamide ribotide isomerase